MPLPLHYMFGTQPGGIHTHKEKNDTMNHSSDFALKPAAPFWHIHSSLCFLSSVQWWADGWTSETPLRRHLYRQLQPLPQTDGCQEVPELSLNREEKVGTGLFHSLPSADWNIKDIMTHWNPVKIVQLSFAITDLFLSNPSLSSSVRCSQIKP